MNGQESGAPIPQQSSQLASAPIFLSDNDHDAENITWEIPDDYSDDSQPHQEINKEENQEESSIVPESEDENSTDQLPQHSEEEVEDTKEEEEKKKKRNRVSERKRISELTRQLKQAQSVTHDVLARNQFLETKLSEKEKQALESEENFLTSQKERVKAILADAIEEGDPAKITEAHDLLSQYNAQIQLKKNQGIASPQQVTAPQSYQTAQDISDDNVTEEALEWLERNTWANPNADDFDAELHEEADKYSLKLMKKYKLAGRKNEIGGAEFFNEISDYMSTTYGLEGTTAEAPSYQPKGRTPMKSSPSHPAVPVNRPNHPTSPPRRLQDIVLTPAQKEFAHAMRGFARDPKTGQLINDNKVLEDMYKRNLR